LGKEINNDFKIEVENGNIQIKYKTQGTVNCDAVNPNCWGFYSHDVWNYADMEIGCSFLCSA
jgi:hypothetical protein